MPSSRTITRFNYQKNLHVDSQFGWDCHGLSVEHQVDKKLGLKSLEDVNAIGATAYNEQCRQLVQRNQAEWMKIFERFGIWVDFASSYSTMDVSYMENVWAVFKELFDMGLVYRDTKVLPHSTGCFSHLSNFEAEQNWKEVSEEEFIISVDLVGSDEKLLISTTAPWTLVDSSMMCVNTCSMYVKIKVGEGPDIFILSKDRLPYVFTKDYIVLEEIHGSYLLQFHHRCILPYASRDLDSFPVVGNESISINSGTGILALLPYFEQDHYRLCLEFGLTLSEAACPIDESGRVQKTISPLAGLSIYESNEVIINYLQEHNRIVQQGVVTTKKPHCWRSDVPLINRIASSWFIPVKKFATKLAEKKSQLNWVHGEPNGDLFKLIENSTDWPISRKKFWGTPLPIWSSPSGDEIRCIGSIQELLQLSGKEAISDLHIEHLEHIKIPSSIPGNPPLRRVIDVFDCWFESAVISFTPNRGQADLIIEGHDQTCGWFYTTLILSTALNQPLPSKWILAHGLAISVDGQKLSKRKHNHCDPIQMAEKYGTDAVRLALVSCPLANSENHLLRDHEVRELKENLFRPFYQIVYDMMLSFGKKGVIRYGYITEPKYITNIFDLWILSRMESVLQSYYSDLKAYRVNHVVSRILHIIEDLQSWYAPNRSVRKGKRWSHPAHVYFNIVYRICVMLSPFAPVFVESVYQYIRPYDARHSGLFHESLLPWDGCSLIQADIETKIDRWRSVIVAVRDLRAKHIIPLEYRITELLVIHPLEDFLANNEDLHQTLMKYTNFRDLSTSQNWSMFGACLRARLKEQPPMECGLSAKEFENIALRVSKLTEEELKAAVRKQQFEFSEHDIPLKDVELFYEFNKEPDINIGIATKDALLVAIRMNKELSYYAEGTRLELISIVRKARTKANVYPNERITICCSTSDTFLQSAFRKFSSDLERSTNSIVEAENSASVDGEELIFKETINIKGTSGVLNFFRKC